MKKKAQFEDSLPCVDPEHTFKILKLDERLKQAEKDNDKVNSAISLEHCLQQIITYHQSLNIALNRELRLLLDPIDLLQASLKQAIIGHFSTEQALTEMDEHIAVVQVKHAQEREHKHKEHVELTKQVNLFRGQNKLSRLSERPESGLWHIAVAISLVLVESVANGFFLSKGLEGGLLAGLVQAIVIAGISVYISYSAGALVRGLFHRLRKYQLISTALLIFYSIFIVSYHLAVGHLRIALDHNPEQAYQQAILRLMEVPFQLNSFDSVMLLILGIVFSLTALYAGTKSDDLTPGYGVLSVRAQSTDKEAHDLRLHQLNDVAQITESVAENGRELCIESKRNIAGEFVHSQLNKRKILKQYELAIQSLNNSHSYCLAVYRMLNPEGEVFVNAFEVDVLDQAETQLKEDDEWLDLLLSQLKQAGADYAQFKIEISHKRLNAIGFANNQSVSVSNSNNQNQALILQA